MRGVPVTALSVVGLGYIPVNLKRCQFLDFSQVGLWSRSLHVETFSRPFDDGHNWNMLDPFGI
jgi:hypothetical protein